MDFLSKRTIDFSNLIKKTVFTRLKDSLMVEEAFELIYTYFQLAIKNHKKVFIVGNGGSSGIASHHMVDLVNVLNLAAFTLSDSNLITCMGNDYGYQHTYARPLNTLASEKDLLIAISSSGQSENILETCRVMRAKKGSIITLSGFKEDNPLRAMGDINVWTGIADYGLVESAHFFILHTLVDGWKHRSSIAELLEEKSKRF